MSQRVLLDLSAHVVDGPVGGATAWNGSTTSVAWLRWKATPLA